VFNYLTTSVSIDWAISGKHLSCDGDGGSEKRGPQQLSRSSDSWQVT